MFKGENMLKIYNLRDKQEYVKEVAILIQNEWGERNLSRKEFENKINRKINQIKNLFDNQYYCKLILLDDKNLVGFISIFPKDGNERKYLSPWYATMYVKEEYRGKGYSKILNNAILNEAKKRKIEKIFLKTRLENYYEKFGAIFIDKLSNGEKLYCINL